MGLCNDQLFEGVIDTPVRKRHQLTGFTKLNSDDIVLWSVMDARLGEKMFVQGFLGKVNTTAETNHSFQGTQISI